MKIGSGLARWLSTWTLIGGVCLAQDGTLPASFTQALAPLSSVALIEMPSVEAALALLLADPSPDKSRQFALPLAVGIDPAAAGTWERAGAERVWRLRIRSGGARSLNFGFEHYKLPAGARLFLYAPDRGSLRGPFTAQDNEVHGQLWTPIVLGEETVLELNLPAAAAADVELRLSRVNHGFRDFGAPPALRSGSCNVDVVCPQGDAWRSEIRSVAVISTGGSTFCTGFLVNNTAQDFKPYFMTARHCGLSSSNAASLVAYWNYFNSTCRPPGSSASGGPGDGSLAQFNTGSFWRAEYIQSDFELVELDDPPSQTFNVHWAGWNRSSADPTSAVAIHHPNTDEKRISFENQALTTTSYFGNASPGDGTHLRVADWDLGTTEPGSSGSPLFDPNHRVIGQLHGGSAACGNDLADWYGRFSRSWTGGATNSSRLSNWLDPIGSGAVTLDGLSLARVVVGPAAQLVGTGVRTLARN